MEAAGVAPLPPSVPQRHELTSESPDQPCGLKCEKVLGKGGGSPERIWVVVTEVRSPAEAAGLQPGDILIRVQDGHPRDVQHTLGGTTAVKVRALRHGWDPRRRAMANTDEWAWHLAARDCPWAQGEEEREQVAADPEETLEEASESRSPRSRSRLRARACEPGRHR